MDPDVAIIVDSGKQVRAISTMNRAATNDQITFLGAVAN